jgi:hypothetical protein
VAKPAIAFLRKDQVADVTGALDEQSAAIEAYADDHGYDVVLELAFRHTTRQELFNSPPFESLMLALLSGRTSTIIFANATSLDADPFVQLAGLVRLRRHNIECVVVSQAAPAVTSLSEGLVEQTLTVSDDFEAHIRRSKERYQARFAPVRRKIYAELYPEAVNIAKGLHKKSLSEGVRISLREMSAMLANQGHLNTAGKPYHPDEVRRMIKGPDPLRPMHA